MTCAVTPGVPSFQQTTLGCVDMCSGNLQNGGTAREDMAVLERSDLFMKALEVRELVKDYGRFRAARGISFGVREGEVFGLKRAGVLPGEGSITMATSCSVQLM